MTNFKVGDKVVCVKGGHKGSGWKLGLTFIIYNVCIVGNNIQVCWPEKVGDGVFSDSLELVRESYRPNSPLGMILGVEKDDS